ncbi:hypothetical protein FH972_023036 [Carpinus fangiana]|uniref:Uncharacterized protein n=1 Tax=Carpinus fangiana TaxID=176857 RepID=A0A5N6KUA4_9ROSI|nr:hypothetical protein FH972_023036 [Carpinus fangiana]
MTGMKHPPARAVALLKESILNPTPQALICSQCIRHLSTTRQWPRNGPIHRLPHRRLQSTWTSAVGAAQSFLGQAKQTDPVLPGGVKIDPFKTVAKEMKFLTNNIRQLLGSGHPTLDTVAKYYTQAEGKHIRPMLVLLMSQATASMTKDASHTSRTQEATNVDISISPSNVLLDVNPDFPSTLTAEDAVGADVRDGILPSQRRLAEITELIHTASLLHDDVIDHSTERRAQASANIEFGNKMAVLAGDFLLGRASVALARLRNPEVTELLATVIANLIEGEFMQLQNTARDETRPVFVEQDTLNYYLQKTYLKSASLISKSCRAAALLGNCAPAVVDAAYSYGKNLGLAFQLVDDMLDFTALDNAQLGKPAGADLELGLATAPLLFAWKERPELGEMIGRKFSRSGDVAKARETVLQSSGIEQTRALAQEYVDKAADALSAFPDGGAKNGLLEMCTKVMSRKK